MFLIELILLGYCVYFVSYSLFFSIGGLFYKKQLHSNSSVKKNRFAILIPGYKEDAIIINTIKNNLKVKYPQEAFDIVIIADSFKKETLDAIREYPVKLQEVSFEKSTKVKALSYTITRLPNEYDYIVVLDADNIIEPEYLSKVNQYLNNTNAKAIQTQRWPKNMNNDLAILDGISESINNHIYRQGAYSTGFSVSLNGSGMIFEKNIFQRLITSMESIGGFDRELEFRLLQEGIKVKYFKEALVEDQKTDDNENFNNQRTRWISSQYVYLFKYFKKGVLALLKGNIIYFHSTVWRNIQLPRLINLGLLTVFTASALLLKNHLYYNYMYWISLWLLNAFSMAISIPRKLYSKQLLISVFKLPKLFLSMLLIMFKLKNANKKFIHTEHKAV